jgi:hypothetical protein
MVWELMVVVDLFSGHSIVACPTLSTIRLAADPVLFMSLSINTVSSLL